MTKALITGCGGMVGSHLAEYLLTNTDWEIWGMLRWSDPTDNLENLAPLANRGDRVHFVYADLRDAWSVRDIVRIAKPDYAFHLAAQSYPQTSFTAPADTLETNIIGTVNFLEAMKDHARTAFIHVCASSEVYGKVSRKYIPIKEDTPFNPASPYSVSKAGTDMIGSLYARAYSMRIMISRAFTHTGARRGDVFAESTFAKQVAMIEAGLQEPPIRHGNLDSVRTITDVRDMCRAYHMLLTTNCIPGESYNIGTTQGYPVRKILNTLNIHDYPTEVDPDRLRPVDADLQIPDVSKFRAASGWEAQIPFEDTMLDLLNYWRRQVKRGVHLIR